MNVPRLKVLAKYLRSLKVTKENSFNMGSWFSRRFKPAQEVVKQKLVSNANKCEIKKVKEVEEGFCHTSACILGHAAQIQEFKRAGLKIKYNNSYTVEFETDGATELVEGQVMFRNQYGEEAGAAFFGLERDDADNLFHGSFSKPETGAKAIERLIARHEKEQARVRKAA